MELKSGITYMHEHITIDLSGIKKDSDCKLDIMDDSIEEIKALKSLGVSNIIDLTNRGMGRSIEYMSEVSKETGINIIPATGYYKEPFFPEEVYKLSQKELTFIMVKEITEGIEGTGVKAGIIGEIGSGKEGISDTEKKVLKAAAAAHMETGKLISTHTTLGKLGIEQVKIFKDMGADLNSIIIGHVDLSGDIEYILRLIDKGVYVAFDTIGKINYMAEEKRLEMLKGICGRGLSGRVVMSMDITRKSAFKKRGGVGYSYLIENFIPYVKENGIGQKDIDNMLINNPIKIFDGK